MTDGRRVAILGDIGGQREVFEQVIRDIGGDPVTGMLPPEITLVQVGDLVRMTDNRNLDSDGCVALAERLRATNSGRYIQLVGNHDAAAIGGPRRPTWNPNNVLTDNTVTQLNEWWSRRQVRLALALDSVELGPALITHAGLTRALWEDLGRPNAQRAAQVLNTAVGRPPAEVFRAGRLVTGSVDPSADVTWAEVSTELYEPWLSTPMPFNQIHGHASPWNWSTNDWWPDTPAALRSATTRDPATHRTVTTLGSRPNGTPALAICVDWTLGDTPTPATWPLLSLAPRA